MVRIDKKLLKQIIFYVVVGTITFGIDVTVTTLLYDFLHFPAYLAAGIGFLSGFIFNFPVNRKKVFHHNDQDKYTLKTQIVLYTCLSLFNLFVSALLTQLFVSRAHLKIEYSKAAATIIIAMWNFLVYKFLIFSKKNQTKKQTIDERTLGDIF